MVVDLVRLAEIYSAQNAVRGQGQVLAMPDYQGMPGRIDPVGTHDGATIIDAARKCLGSSGIVEGSESELSVSGSSDCQNQGKQQKKPFHISSFGQAPAHVAANAIS
jgi:hypothetical protein